MRELRHEELEALQEVLGEGEETEQLPDDLEEAIRRIEAAFVKPDVAAVVVFPLHGHRRFPIPPKKTRI